MKRVASACLLQTLNFVLDPNVSLDEAKAKVEVEVYNYKKDIDPKKLVIQNETHNEDGTVTISVKKAVSGYSVGSYFD